MRENPASLWNSVNLGASLYDNITVSQRNSEAAQGAAETRGFTNGSPNTSKGDSLQ
jgi:hypothetical protein